MHRKIRQHNSYADPSTNCQLMAPTVYITLCFFLYTILAIPNYIITITVFNNKNEPDIQKQSNIYKRCVRITFMWDWKITTNVGGWIPSNGSDNRTFISVVTLYKGLVKHEYDTLIEYYHPMIWITVLSDLQLPIDIKTILHIQWSECWWATQI